MDSALSKGFKDLLQAKAKDPQNFSLGGLLGSSASLQKINTFSEGLACFGGWTGFYGCSEELETQITQGAWIKACEKGDLKWVQFLMESPVEGGWFKVDVNDRGSLGFRWACIEGHLEIVKYLLTSPELKKAGHAWADMKGCSEDADIAPGKETGFVGACRIAPGKETGFVGACRNGHLEVVKYLLTSKELIETGHDFADLHQHDELALRWACIKGHVEVVKYLLTSKELIEAGHTFADLHASDGVYSCFELACDSPNKNLVRWLVLDYGLKKTMDMELLMDQRSKQKGYALAKECFRIQEEHQEISKSIKANGHEIQKDNQEDGGQAGDKNDKKRKKRL